MQISRRNALLGATAAAAVAGVPVAVQAALAGDPVLPAYEAFEAVRRQYIATSDHIDTIRKAIDVEMPPHPHPNRTYLELSAAEWDETCEWRGLYNRHMESRLGADEDDIMNAQHDRISDGFHDLMDIQATTAAGLLCQVRAWWAVYETVHDTEVPEPGPEDSFYDPDVVVRRLYHDIARLAGEAWS